MWYDTFLIARTRKPQEKSSKMLFITLKMLLELSSQDDLRFNEPMKAMRNNNGEDSMIIAEKTFLNLKKLIYAIPSFSGFHGIFHMV